MNNIGGHLEKVNEHFKKQQKGPKISNSNQFYVQTILDVINKDREGTQYPLIKWQRLNGMLHNHRTKGHIKRLCDIAEKEGARSFWVEYNRLMGKYEQK